jgi:hypothetical protein
MKSEKSDDKEKQIDNKTLLTCFWCGMKGHIASTCRKKQKGEPQTEAGKTAFIKKNTVNYLVASSDSESCCVDIVLDGVVCTALLDTGARNISLISPQLVAQFPTSKLNHESATFSTITGEKVICSLCVRVQNLEYNGSHARDVKLFVLPTWHHKDFNVLVGSDVLQKISTDQNLFDTVFSHDVAVEEDWELRPTVATLHQSHPDLLKKIMSELHDIIEENKKLLHGSCTLKQAEVFLPLKNEERGVYIPQYAIPFKLHEAVNAQILDWKDRGIISIASCSKHNLPLVAAPKKDANGNWTKTRVCLDLRQLNSQLLFEDRHPLPKIKDLLRNFGSCKFFSMFDLKEAFLQLRVAIADRHKLTFT